MNRKRILTSINHAIKWWLDGFQYLLPGKLKKFPANEPNTILLTLSADTLFCQLASDNGRNILQEQAFQLDATELVVQQISSWLDKYRTGSIRLVYLLPAKQVLCKEINMPASAENDLNQILRFEMDRHTPFTIEQVYFDYVVSEQKLTDDQIRTNLYVAQRAPVDKSVDQLKKLGFKLDQITCLDSDDCMLPVNLIPHAERHEGPRQNYRLTWGITCLTVLLYIAGLVLPVHVRQSQIETMEKQLTMLRSEAVQVQALMKERDLLLVKNNFITDKQAERIPSIIIVNELSELLPDDTWLQRLIIKENEIQLLGESANASSLIALLDNSDKLQAPAFRSPVTHNQATQKDKFQLTVNLAGMPDA